MFLTTNVPSLSSSCSGVHKAWLVAPCLGLMMAVFPLAGNGVSTLALPLHTPIRFIRNRLLRQTRRESRKDIHHILSISLFDFRVPWRRDLDGWASEEQEYQVPHTGLPHFQGRSSFSGSHRSACPTCDYVVAMHIDTRFLPIITISTRGGSRLRRRPR